MQFTHLLFLVASAAIIGPILAHLLNRSKFRKIPFTMLQFLQASQKQTQSKRRLRDLLILLLRCAIIVCVAMLFAGPVLYKQVQEDTFRQVHFLLLDDSLSMSCKDGLKSCFEKMLDDSRDYLDANKGPQSIFNLYSITTGCIGQDLTAEAAAQMLNSMEIQPGRADLTTLLSDLKHTERDKGAGDTVFVHTISDFSRTLISALEGASTAATVDQFSYKAVFSRLAANNLAVTDAHVVNLNDDLLTLAATVQNYGSQTAKRLVRAGFESVYSNEVVVSPAPGQQQDVVLVMDVSGLLNQKTTLPIEVKLTPEDDLTADDTFPLAVSILQDTEQKILLMGHNTSELFLIQTALKALKQSQGTRIGSVDTELFSDFQMSRVFSYDIVIASGVDRDLKPHTDQIRQFIEAGGRWIFFAGGDSNAATSEMLYSKKILPALPLKKIEKVVHPGSEESHLSQTGSDEERLLSILSQYKLEQIPVWAYHQCRIHPETLSLWPLDPQAAMVYQKTLKAGTCTLMNTSIDDRCSGLTKNPAALPLIQYLLGFKQQVAAYSAAADESIAIALPRKIHQQRIDYIDAADQRHTAELSDAFLRIAGPHPCGWIRTLTDPVYYIGVHPAEGETDLTRSTASQIEKTLAGLFETQPQSQIFTAQNLTAKHEMGLEKIFVGLIIALILLDAFIANRMQRS